MIRSVPGFPNYSVSDDGVVYGLRGPLKPHICRNGYHSVYLYRNGKRFYKGIHQLVLLTFVGEPPDGHETCHNDHDKSNNSLTNLRYGTKVENTRDRIHNGNHVGQKLTHKQVTYIRRSTKSGRELATELNISEASVSMIRNRKRWA